MTPPATAEASPVAGATPLPPDATIHQRMVRILAELPAIGRDQRNTQQNFNFRGYDDVLNALNPLMGEHGVFIVPDVVERITAERQTSGGKTMYEVNLHIRFRFYGLAGDYVEASGWGEGTDMGDKATNKATTAAIKYVLDKVFAISTLEASDADASSPEETTRPSSQAGGGSRQGRQQASASLNSWAEMKAALVATWDAETARDFSVFADQLAGALYDGANVGDVFGSPDGGALTPGQWQEFGGKVAAAVKALLASDAGDGFPPPSREQIGRVFEGVSGGIGLDGPEWRMGPGEDDRPVRES